MGVKEKGGFQGEICGLLHDQFFARQNNKNLDFHDVIHREVIVLNLQLQSLDY